MTIASAITTKQQQVADSYTAVSNKGGTLPTTQNLTNLATAIDSIPSGGGIGIPREVKNGVYQMPTEIFTFSLPNDATNVGNHGLDSAFYGCTGLTSIDLSALTTLSGSYALSYAFRNCTGLTSVDLSSLTTVGSYGLNYAFSDCSGLTSIDLSALTDVGSNGLYSAFSDCTGLTSIDLSALNNVGTNGLYYAFRNCTSLTSVNFNSLNTSSFGTTKTQFRNMMQGTGKSVVHTLHFPSNMESTISGLTGYPLFSGTSGYVVCAFDLDPTE